MLEIPTVCSEMHTAACQGNIMGALGDGMSKIYMSAVLVLRSASSSGIRTLTII